MFPPTRPSEACAWNLLYETELSSKITIFFFFPLQLDRFLLFVDSGSGDVGLQKHS